MASSLDDEKNLEFETVSHLPNDNDLATAFATRGQAAQVSGKVDLDVVAVVLNRVEEDNMMAVSRSCFNVRSQAGLRLLGIIFVMGFNQAGYGVDWAVIGSINSYPTWHAFFNFPNDGPILGTLNALMSIGGFVGAPLLAFSDLYGRRSVNFAGNFIVIIGAIMQSQAPNIGVFMVGRFLLGFGTSLCTSCQYMAEISPVHLRGRLVGLFGACFQIGSVCMSGVMIAFSRWSTSDWQWRAPLLIQAFPAIIVCSSIYFLCPETPRYLVMKGRHDEAKRVIAQVMTGSNDVDAPIVPLMLRQIEESLETAISGVQTLRAVWDFRPFLTKRVGYRSMLLVLYAMFQQWNGGAIIGTYLSPALETIGITSSLHQTTVNLGLTAEYFVFTLVGSYLIDTMTRRSLFYAGLGTFIATQTAVTVTSWRYNVAPNTALAGLTLLWVFINNACSAAFIATMHNLYPVEILSLSLRAKGMALFALLQCVAGVIQTYGISIGIAKLGYKIWVVYIIYNSIQLVLVKFLFPETSKLTLEDIDHIFETPGHKPVDISLRLAKARKERERAAREESRDLA